MTGKYVQALLLYQQMTLKICLNVQKSEQKKDQVHVNLTVVDGTTTATFVSNLAFIPQSFLFSLSFFDSLFVIAFNPFSAIFTMIKHTQIIRRQFIELFECV